MKKFSPDKKTADSTCDRFPALIHGGVGNDDLRAGGGPTELIGGAGNDRLRGDGDDVLDGGLSNDRLDGDEGNDHLMGGMKGR